MSKSYSFHWDHLYPFLEDVYRPEDEKLRLIRERSHNKGLSPIQVGNFDGLHLEVITRMVNPRRVVEVGTLGGYSAVCMARGLTEGGKIWTLEIDPAAAKVARENISFAQVDDRVEVIEGPALQSLVYLEKLGPFDMIFIDADKISYPKYLEWAEVHLRVGGVLIADNTFGWGRLLDQKFSTPAEKMSIEGLVAFNQRLASSPRFRATILPTGEGLSLAVKAK